MTITTDRSPYIAFIDGMRAVAVLAVMLYHLDQALLPGGFVGVDVFFVISGFVVTASLAGHGQESLGRFLGHFYVRRLARLMPALVAMLVTTTLAYVLLVPKAWFNRAAESVGQAAFWGLSNWVLDRHTVNYFEPRAELNPFTHTWSLGVEEQFYLIAPLLLYVALRRPASSRHRQLAIFTIAILAVLSLTYCYYLGVTQGARVVFYLLPFRFWELACGALLFLLLPRVRQLSARLDSVGRLSAVAGVLLLTAAMLAPNPSAYPYLRATIAVVGTLLLIGTAHAQPQDFVRRTLASRPALWIGQRSYGLYLCLALARVRAGAMDHRTDGMAVQCRCRGAFLPACGGILQSRRATFPAKRMAQGTTTRLAHRPVPGAHGRGLALGTGPARSATQTRAREGHPGGCGLVWQPPSGQDGIGVKQTV